MKTPLEQALQALETFDRAAQAHGWAADQGSEEAAKRAKRLYNAAKARVRSKIAALVMPPPAVIELLIDAVAENCDTANLDRDAARARMLEIFIRS